MDARHQKGVSMRLILRLIIELLRSRAGVRTDIGVEIVAHFLVLPTDLDFNGHMTNNRYHTVMDYAALGLLGSHGILAAMFKQRWRPIVGCSLISHRKSLKIFDRYIVRSKVIYCDEVWSYLSHIIEHDGQIIAAANRKYALLGQNGLVTSKKLFAEIGNEFDTKPADLNAVRSWVDAEKTILEHSLTDNVKPCNNIGVDTTVMECKKEIANKILSKQPDVKAQPCLYANLECATQLGCPAQKETTQNDRSGLVAHADLT